MSDQPKREEIERMLNQTRALMARSREYLLEKTAAGFQTYTKSDQSEVTDIDRAVEEFLREALRKSFPGHGIIGEEYDAENQNAEFVWFIDPIDGTQNFANGIPTYASIVALHQAGHALLAIVDHPALNRCYSAGRGLGFYENDIRRQLPPEANAIDPRVSLVTLSSPANYARTGDVPKMTKFLEQHGNVRIYGDAFSQTSAAAGRVGGAVHYNVKPWDVAAVPVLIEEAGGCYLEKIADGDGGPYHRVVHGRRSVVEYLKPWFIG
ncbi:MAG: inositol monophosphatase [Deltaproteobacteria bacterium]|nr:inositol monophosphatase [Deltaproteobacteria bacterium]